jgi:antitoxin (DNA-binding transcriptional repressor) of toxin-antitoxin stability system
MADVREAQVHLQELLSFVREGIEIVLTEGVTPFARLAPIVLSSAWTEIA